MPADYITTKSLNLFCWLSQFVDKASWYFASVDKRGEKDQTDFASGLVGNCNRFSTLDGAKRPRTTNFHLQHRGEKFNTLMRMH